MILTPGQLRIVEQRARSLRVALGDTTPADDKVVIENDWLLDGIYHSLRDLGLGATLIPPKDLPSKTYLRYQRTSKKVRSALESRITPTMRPAEKLALGRIIGSAYIAYVREWLQSTAIEKLLDHIGRVPDALDAAFPSYLETGMLGVLIRSRTMMKE